MTDKDSSVPLPTTDLAESLDTLGTLKTRGDGTTASVDGLGGLRNTGKDGSQSQTGGSGGDKDGGKGEEGQK